MNRTEKNQRLTKEQESKNNNSKKKEQQHQMKNKHALTWIYIMNLNEFVTKTKID